VQHRIASAILLACTAAACSGGGNKGSDGDGGSQASGPVDIMTDKGVVRGSADSVARAFVGIPFAAPPVGALRFMPPKEAPAWSAPLQASTSPAECPQFDFNGKVADGSSEDCLYLNVWTPLADVKNAPVFVWIYGGGFVTGSSGMPLYNGERLVEKTNAIVVSLNYRLGPLGFFAHPAVASAVGAATAPPAGLLDQQMALRWVQRNIAAFGGDPTKVTIAGESAGGISVCAHLVMSGAQGLFANAIIESGLCNSFLFLSKAAAEDQANRLAAAVGCTDAGQALGCLQGKTPEQILGALPGRRGFYGATGDTFGPVIDGVVLPKAPYDAIAAGSFVKVPTVMGTNLDEGALFRALWGSPPPTSNELRASLAVFYGSSHVSTIAAHYPVDSDPAKALEDIWTDAVFACPTRKAARALAAAGTPTYLYQFTFPTVTPLYNVTTSHGSEIPFVFRNSYFNTDLADSDVPIADIFDGYWFSLVTSGNPNASPGQGALAWPMYAESSDQNLTIDMPPAVNTHLKQATCDFWDTIE
jgi:para-nitrobenzyl esterase